MEFKKDTNFIVGILNSGIGNKIFLMMEHYAIFKELQKTNKDLKLYFLNQRSPHEKLEKFKIDELFDPIDNVEFINWYIFDKLQISYKPILIKKQPILIDGSYSKTFIESLKIPFVFDYILEKVPQLHQKTIDSFKFNVRNLTTKPKGIGVHIRYGDKIEYNMKHPNSFLLAPPLWYIDAIKTIRKKDEVVILYTDSPSIVKEYILPFIEEPVILSHSNPEETIKEMCFIPKLILTDSTLPLAAIALRKEPCTIILPTYDFKVKHPNELFETSKFIKKELIPVEKISEFSLIELKKSL
jgi:hypothetical protein